MPRRACFLFAVALACLLCPATRTHAQQMGWDTTPGTPGAQGGSGNWLGTNFWYVLPSNSAWTQGAGATFGGTAGTANYVTWRKGLGKTYNYDAWRTHFGQTANGAAVGASAVPESNSFALLLSSMTLIVRGCAQRQLRFAIK